MKEAAGIDAFHRKCDELFETGLANCTKGAACDFTHCRVSV